MLKFSHILFSCCRTGQGRYPSPPLQPFVMKDALPIIPPAPAAPPPLPPPLLTGVLRTRPPSECTVFCHVPSCRGVQPGLATLQATGMDDICHTYFGPLIRRSGPERSGAERRGAGVSAGNCGKCSAAQPLILGRSASSLTTRNMLWGYVCVRA